MNGPPLTAAQALELLGRSARDTTAAVDRIAATLGGDCQCRGTGLRLGGWMGPTRERPFPDPCPLCTGDLTPRERQVLQATYLIEHKPWDVVRDVLGLTDVNDLTFPTATNGPSTLIDWKMP